MITCIKGIKLWLLLVSLCVVNLIPSSVAAADSVTIKPRDWQLAGTSSMVTDKGDKAVKLRLTRGTYITSDKASTLFNTHKDEYVKVCVTSRSNGVGDGLTISAKALAPGYKGFSYRAETYSTRCFKQLVLADQPSGWRRIKLNNFGVVGERTDYIRNVTVTAIK